MSITYGIIGVHDQIIITSSNQTIQNFPNFIGVMPIRRDIEVLPADEPKQLKLGWIVREKIGVAVVNPRGCSKGRKSVVIGS